MFNTSYTTVERIIDEVNSIPLPSQEYSIADIKEWIYKAMGIIGGKGQYMEKTISLEVVDSKTQLPQDFEKFEELFYVDSSNERNYYPMLELRPEEQFKDMSFKIYNNFIYTDFEKGFVYLHYWAFPTDDLGNPLIPDTIVYVQAVVAFIRRQLGERLRWQSVISPRDLDELKRDWYNYLGAAQSEGKIQSKEVVRQTLSRNFPPVVRKEWKIR